MDKLSGSWRRVFDRFWFVPAVCVLAAVVLAQSVVAVDRWLPEDLDSPWIAWVYAVGIDGSRSMLSAIGGSMIGVAGKGETLDIVPRLLITGRRVTGSSFGGVRGRTQVPQLVDRWLRGDVDVPALLSHHITLDEVNKGFDLMHHQDGIRTIIGFD